MNRFPRIVAVLFTLAIVAIALVGAAGHRPVCCKGYMYWDILERKGGGQQWRKVKDPIKLREVPITPSVWDLGEAKQKAALAMHARASFIAHGLDVKARDWDAICWHYGDAEPVRHSWPVQP